MQYVMIKHYEKIVMSNFTTISGMNQRNNFASIIDELFW